eukprot:11496146-Karenia_brevis.AAC.1
MSSTLSHLAAAQQLMLRLSKSSPSAPQDVRYAMVRKIDEAIQNHWTTQLKSTLSIADPERRSSLDEIIKSANQLAAGLWMWQWQPSSVSSAPRSTRRRTQKGLPQSR